MKAKMSSKLENQSDAKIEVTNVMGLGLPRAFVPGSPRWSFRLSDYYRVSALKYYFNKLSGSVLDFGCGDKPYEKILRHDAITDWIGVDLEKRTTGVNAANQADFFYDGARLPFEEATFDIAVATQVLEHIDDWEKALAEIARVTKSGGKILLTVPMTGVLHEEPFDFSRFTPYGMSKAAVKSGLTLDASVALGGVISTVATLAAGHVNFLSRVPVFGKPIHGGVVGAATQGAYWLEKLVWNAGYKKTSVTTDFLFALTRR